MVGFLKFKVGKELNEAIMTRNILGVNICHKYKYFHHCFTLMTTATLNLQRNHGEIRNHTSLRTKNMIFCITMAACEAPCAILYYLNLNLNSLLLFSLHGKPLVGTKYQKPDGTVVSRVSTLSLDSPSGKATFSQESF